MCVFSKNYKNEQVRHCKLLHKNRV